MATQSKRSINRSLLAEAYPSADEWKELVKLFSSEAIAHKLLLAQIPYVFKDEPLKYALFRHTIAEAFGIDPSGVFIVGSAMAGRSLKGNSIDKVYKPGGDSDIDTLIVSEQLFIDYVMKSLDWLKGVTRRDEKTKKYPTLDDSTTKHISYLSEAASKGIWRPDSLPSDAPVRNAFFSMFNHVSLKTLGLQLSEDTVARVTGRIARSYSDAISDLAQSIYRLKKEFGVENAGEVAIQLPDDDE